MIKVMIVEDSPVVREFLVHLLSLDPEIKVIGAMDTGEEALEAVGRLKPDVITIDIHLPKIDGLEVTRRIMETHPTPVVIVTGSTGPKEMAATFGAMESGALAILPRPAGIGHPAHDRTAAEFVQTVKLMSEVRVVKRWPRSRQQSVVPPVDLPAPIERRRKSAKIKVVAIGASTGGPPVIQIILSKLPKNFPAPVLIVQHMAEGFTAGFAEWLKETSKLPVHLAVQDEHLLPGHVYIAPDGFQMKIGVRGTILLTRDAPENGHRPSVSYLFRSVRDVYGENAAGALLSGMGKDGAEELKRMKDKGAVTVVQDKKSSVVFGMPGEAVKLDAAMYVLPPEEITGVLTHMVNNASGET